MTLNNFIQVILFAIALSADAFAVAVTDGLVYTDINKKRSFFIAIMFGLFQAIMPLIGYFVVELISYMVNKSAGDKAGDIMATIITWISFGLLLYIGMKMIIETISEIKSGEKEKILRKFSVKEVFVMALATAIDALAVGVAFHKQDVNGVSFSSNTTIFIHVAIIMVITFGLSLIGLFLGKQIEKLFKGKPEISEIVGGSILIILAVWIVISHYF
mgnify:CR=1 FL=1